MFNSQIVARHIKRRVKGDFSSPKHELYEIDKLLEMDLNRSEKAWAFSRRRKLREQVYSPSARFLIFGARPGGVRLHNVAQEKREEVQMRKEIIAIHTLLEKS